MQKQQSAKNGQPLPLKYTSSTSKIPCFYIFRVGICHLLLRVGGPMFCYLISLNGKFSQYAKVNSAIKQSLLPLIMQKQYSAQNGQPLPMKYTSSTSKILCFYIFRVGICHLLLRVDGPMFCHAISFNGKFSQYAKLNPAKQQSLLPPQN